MVILVNNFMNLQNYLGDSSHNSAHSKPVSGAWVFNNPEVNKKITQDFFREHSTDIPGLQDMKISPDYFHENLAEMVCLALAHQGYTLAEAYYAIDPHAPKLSDYELTTQLRAIFSHERNSITRLRDEFSIVVSPIEWFLIAFHQYYPTNDDIEALRFALTAEPYSLEEIMLLLNIITFCDVFENENNTERLRVRRGMSSQQLEVSFKQYDHCHPHFGSFGIASQMMKQLLLSRDHELLEIIREGRGNDDSRYAANHFTETELLFLEQDPSMSSPTHISQLDAIPSTNN